MNPNLLFGETATFKRSENPNEPSKSIKQYNDSLQGEITVHQKLNVGDIVLLKKENDKVVVKYINYKMPGVGILPYIGQIIEGKFQGELRVFGQYDIERINLSNEKEEKKGEEK